MVGLLVALSVMREDTVGEGSNLGGEGGKEERKETSFERQRWL